MSAGAPADSSRTAVQPAPAPTVLLVDDNRPYREAFRRHLELNDIDVVEAENSDEALAALAAGCPRPTMVITDLQMRSETEGLDLIRAIRSTAPILPIALISAVGTFEEGAEAQRLGAAAVFSKARIDEDLSRLVACVRERSDRHHIDSLAAKRLESARHTLQPDTEPDAPGAAPPASIDDALAGVRAILADNNLHPYLRQEAYSLLAECEASERVRASQSAAMDKKALLDEAGQTLSADLESFSQLAPESREALLAAEVLRLEAERGQALLDFSRNQGFSYCFAVENEVKARLGRRIAKFLAADSTFALLPALLNTSSPNPALTVFFHQHMLLLLRGRDMDITIDNIRQTLLRIHEHRGRYKPDGLKALGILLITFGRDYTLPAAKQSIRVNNPLGIKGLESAEDVMDFAHLLVSLQHYRNPYIHPEISDMEKVAKIRETTLRCLEITARVQP